MSEKKDPDQLISEVFEAQRMITPDFEGMMQKEKALKEKIDTHGIKWKKIYVGGGSHFDNWFEQCREIYGNDKLMIEECETALCQCYTQSGEKMKRIWVKTD